MSYGTIKVNTITFTNNGVDQSVTVSGIVASTSGNLTVTGTVSGSTASFANGTFNTFSGGTCTITSGVLASGTASNPAISFNGDVNTGIYSPNADEIGFTTNGQARFIIDANGQLEASSAGSASSPTYTFANDVDTGLYSPGTNQLALSTGGVEKVKLSDSEVVFNDGGGNVDFRVEGDTNANLLFVDASTDRAGIRTNTPEQPLDMRGGAFASNQNFGFQIGTPNGEWKARFSIKSDSSGVSRTAIDALSDNLGGTIEAISVRSNGNVGIGTASPGGLLELSGTGQTQQLIKSTDDTRAQIRFLNTANSDVYIGSTSGDFRVLTNTLERARIDSSGRLLIGTSTHYTIGESNQWTLQATNSVGISNLRTGATNGPSYLVLGKTRAISAGSFSILQINDAIGEISFAADDGTDYATKAAIILCQVDGTPGANDMPGRLVFSTTADGGSSPTEALRITNDQVIAYNQAAPVSKSTAVTLTIEELKNGIIQYTGNAQTLTLPTGTSSEGGFSGLYNNMTFEWSVINTGSGTCTVAGNTGHTVVGAGAVAAGSSGRFASRRTGANTFVTYRLS